MHANYAEQIVCVLSACQCVSVYLSPTTDQKLM